MSNDRAYRGFCLDPRGFSLIEMALVLVVVGVILGIGTSAWMSINDARRITMTSNRMQAAKNCLITRVVNSHRYPSYTPAYGSPAGNEVDACVGERLDGWGGPIYFMEGFRPDGSALSGGCLLEDEALPTNHPCGSDNAPVLPSDDSEAIDRDGNTVEDVAFILVSFGEDMAADDASYGGVLGPPLAVTMDASTDPDFEFNADEDDVVLIVTVHDLLAAIARSEQ